MSAKKLAQDEFQLDQSVEESQSVTEQGGEPTQAQSKAAPAARNGKFDPAQYLSKFDGRDYLEVKWRLLWLRNEHPDARMATEIVQHNEESGFALFRAEVEVPGGGKSTGWGSETVRDFHDYIEAAETKAVGRALAALGYGTQFCQDFDFSANARPGTAQVVDAPVNLAAPRNIVDRASTFVQKGYGNGNGPGGGKGFGNAGRLPTEEDEFDRLPGLEASPGGSAATEKQLKAIYAIGRVSKRLSENQVDDRAVEVFGVKPTELTKAEASQFIDMLKSETAA